jgi:uncharacterized protein YjbI with pentapeptide repeats
MCPAKKTRPKGYPSLISKLSPSQMQQKQSNFLEKNWSAKKVLQRLRLTEISSELHEIKAHQFYKKRVEVNRDGTREEDWENAKECLVNNSQDILFWRSKNISIKSWQCIGETLNKFINFFWKTLPASDWVKILATPLILSVATALITNHFQEQSKLNETVSKYFEKMEKLIVEERIDILENDAPTKILIKGESLFTLRSIDIGRREALMSFLSEFGLLDHNKNGISLGYFDLSKINLSGFKLTGIDLNNTLFSKANLRGANLGSANLRGANLRDADLGVANLNNADLSNTDLRGAILDSAALFHSDLSHSDFSEAKLRYALLNEAKLIKSKLRGADLRNALLIDANLTGADLRKANLFHADLKDANFTGADLSDADLREAYFMGTNFSSSDLRKTDLRGAVLRGVEFRDADLRDADLRNTNLFGVNLFEANLSGAKLTGMRRFSPGQIKSANNWESAIYDGKRLNDPEVSKQLGLD